MSDIVKSTKTDLPEVKSKGGIAKPRKPRPSAPPVDETVDIGDVKTEAAVDLTDVAIAAADVPFVAAHQAFDDRYKQNLVKFGQHITGRQQQTSEMLIQQIYGHFGLSEGDIYEQE